MTLNNLVGLDLLEIKALPMATLEALTAEPRPAGQLGLRWDDARYALSLSRCPRRPY